MIFDNILLTDSEEEAAEYRAKYWKPKFEKEQKLAKEKADKESEERKAKQPKLSFKVQANSFLGRPCGGRSIPQVLSEEEKAKQPKLPFIMAGNSARLGRGIGAPGGESSALNRPAVWGESRPQVRWNVARCAGGCQTSLRGVLHVLFRMSHVPYHTRASPSLGPPVLYRTRCLGSSTSWRTWRS